jgi:hypothetical protein
MPQLQQKTVTVGNESQTIVLKKLKNTMRRGGEWMYVIEDGDTGARIEDPFTSKQRAKQEFRQTVSDIRRGMESNQSGGGPLGSGIGSFMGGEESGGGGPTIPGMSGSVDSTDEDDDGPQLPF